MKLNKEVQYALLFCLYVAQAGRARVSDVAEHLGIPLHFLEQIARRLRLSGLAKSIRGPGGGYELTPDLKVNQVLHAFKASTLLSFADFNRYCRGETEERALHWYLLTLSNTFFQHLDTKFSDIMHTLSKTEAKKLDSLTLESTVN